MKKEKIIWTIVVLGLVLICMANSVWGKRAFAIRMRGKSTNQSGGISRYSRKNHHLTHTSDSVSGGLIRNPPVPDVPPARSIGSSGPIGPPPAYPGLGNQRVPAGGAPPAYSKISPPSYAEAMGYSSYGHHYGSASYPGRHYDYNANNNNNLQSIYSAHNVAGYGSNYGYQRGSNPFNVGNIVAGVGLYHLGHAMLGHSGHDHHHHHHHGYNEEYPHRHHNHHSEEEQEQPTGSTFPPEVENSHIQVNADFDFGPSPAPAPEPAQKISIEPNELSSLNGSTV